MQRGILMVPEIEITEEMIEAGEDVLLSVHGKD
jgi:hypothetical protein